MLSPKENAYKLFSHEMPDYIPKFGEGIINTIPAGIYERPKGGREGTDWFGCVWDCKPEDRTPMPSHNYLFEDICDWREKVIFPDLDNFDWETAAAIDKIDSFDFENNLSMVTIHNGIFERLHMLMGFENALCALLTDPEECKEYFDACAKYKCRLIYKLHKYYKPDIICYHDDWGTQLNLFFSPDTWRNLIKPATKKIVDYTKELGMFFEIHSCGRIDSIIPEFVADVRPDSLQIMPINDIPKLKKITGNKVVYNVGTDVQPLDALDATGSLTEEYVRSESRKHFFKMAEGGCYLPTFSRTANLHWRDVMSDEFDKMRMTVYAK